MKAVQRPINKAIQWVLLQAKKAAAKLRNVVAGKGGERGTETPEARSVKAQALKDAGNELSGLERTEQVPAKLREIEGRYQPKGLLSLSLEREDTKGIAVVARASDPERRVITWDEVLARSGTSDYEDVKRAFSASKRPGEENERNAPTVAAMVTVNGEAMGPPLWNVPGKEHAEDRAIDEQWPAAVDRAIEGAKAQRQTKVVFAISKTPCGRCGSRLTTIIKEAKTTLREIGEGSEKYVEFVLAPRSLYEGSQMPAEGGSPEKTATSARQMMELSDLGWDIRQFAARDDEHSSRRFWDVPLAEFAHYLWERVKGKRSS
jgi:hypothetical protein